MPTSVSQPVSSQHSGMGALPYDGGVMFRVWAKFATAVAVVGTFNNWDPTRHPLAPDGDSGYWSGDVTGAASGDEYLFFIPGAPNKGFRMDPYAAQIVDTGNGVLHAVVPTRNTSYVANDYTTQPWNEAVLYEVHVPTFTTDATNSRDQAGTLESALSKLADLKDLGVTAIELMPLGQYEGLSATGYNPGYIFAIEDTYGGPDAFRDFVNTAHASGIAVIVDVVYNHTGDTDLWQFDGWFTADRYCSFDGAVSQQTQGGIYFYQDNRAHTDFAHTRFDYGRPEVQQYLLDNAARWFENRFVDGLRFDSVVNIRGVQVGADYKFDIPDGKALLIRINRQVQGSQPWKLTIAEDLQGLAEITDPVEAGGFGFGAQWNNSFCFALRNAVIPANDEQRPVRELGDQIAATSGPQAFRNIIYTENHDRNDPGQGGGRVPDQICPGSSDSWAAKKRSTLAAAVLLTSPGIPMLFQGQEFLEWQPFATSGNPNPLPIDWTLRAQFAGIRDLYRDLIRLRRNWFNTTRGLRGPNVHVLPVGEDKVLTYHRWESGGAGDDVVVLCNFANRNYEKYVVGMPRSGMWRVRLNSDSAAYDAYFGNWQSLDTEAAGPPVNGMPWSAAVGLPAYSCVILSQD